MGFFYDGRDPEYNQQLVLGQPTTVLLNVRDVCLLMRRSRLLAQGNGIGGYEYNELQLEIWFLEKILRLLDKILMERLTTKRDDQQFYSDALVSDLGLCEIIPGRYFDETGTFENRFEVVKYAKTLFTNFNSAIATDWKFL